MALHGEPSKRERKEVELENKNKIEGKEDKDEALDGAYTSESYTRVPLIQESKKIFERQFIKEEENNNFD